MNISIKPINTKKFVGIECYNNVQKGIVKRFISFINNSSEFTSQDIENYLNYLTRKDRCTNYMRHVRNDLKFLIERYWIHLDFDQYLRWKDFLSKVKFKKHIVKKRSKTLIDDSEFVTTFKNLRKIGQDKAAAIILLYRCTGLRTSEAIRISLEDCRIDLDGFVYIIIYSTKNGKTRTVLIDLESFNFIKSVFHSKKYLLESRKGTQYKDGTIRYHFRKADNLELYPYLFRKTLATRIYENTKDAHLGSEVLGNSVGVFNQYYCKPKVDLSQIKNLVRVQGLVI